MATVLCGNDRTHSQVFDLMPERCRQQQTTAKDAELLKSVSIKVKPRRMNTKVELELFS